MRLTGTAALFFNIYSLIYFIAPGLSFARQRLQSWHANSYLQHAGSGSPALEAWNLSP